MDEWKREELLNEELKQQLEKKVKRRGRMIVLTCVLCALIVLSLLFLLCCQLFFKVKEVKVEGNTVYDSAELLEKAGVKKGDVLFFINSGKIRSNILENYRLIEDITVEKDSPDGVILKVQEERPLFFYETGDYALGENSRTVFAAVAESEKILGIYESRAALEQAYPGLIEVKMPEVRYAVAGNRIQYADEGDEGYIPELIRLIKASVFGEGFKVLDAGSRFNLGFWSYKADGTDPVEVRLGNKKNQSEKIALAESILDKLGKDFSGLICVEDVKKAYARPGSEAK